MEKVMIIAEAGVNHNGNLETAIKLVDTAKAAGADAVKFQIFHPDRLTAKTAKKAEYQELTTGNTETQYEMLKKLVLQKQDFISLYEYCSKKNIIFMASAFDLESIDFLNDLGTTIFKIPSGEITNYLYLEKIASLHKKILLSTGMASLEEIKDALGVIDGTDVHDTHIVLLHCVSAYPAAMEEMNLKAMNTLKNIFHKDVGLSDHSLGIETAVAAVALGAKVIEKHITLDKNMIGPDHSMSLDPIELGDLVKAVRNVEKAMGNGIKEPSLQEMENRKYVRKSLVAARNISKGEPYTLENLDAKRPGEGISPMNIKQLLGKKANRDYREDEQIEE